MNTHNELIPNKQAKLLLYKYNSLQVSILPTFKMTELYLRDDIFANGSGPRMTTNDMRQVLFDCRIETPLFIKQKPKGFIVKFRNENVVNHIMKYPSYDNLRDRNLTPDLSKDTRFYREVLISDIPNTIYDEETDNDIWDELESQNNIKI